MSKNGKKLLIAAALLVLIGCVLFVSAMAMQGWDFTKLSTTKYVTNEYELSGSVKNISVRIDTADVTLVPSESGKASVVCFEQEKVKHSVSVNEGELVIEVNDTRSWYEHIGISFSSPKVTVYLPAGEYGALAVKSTTGDVEIPTEFGFESIDISASTGDIKNYASASGEMKIKATTGDILLEDLSAGNVELSVSTGSVSASGVSCDGGFYVDVTTGKTLLTDVTCKSLMTGGSTGDITFRSVIVAEGLTVKRDTGDVKLERCDAAEIFIETDTGDVSGTLLSEKIFIAESDTGRVDVPKTVSGGRCEIITDTGNIKIGVQYGVS